MNLKQFKLEFKRIHYLHNNADALLSRPLSVTISGLEGTFKLFNLYTKQNKATTATTQSKPNMSPYNVYP